MPWSSFVLQNQTTLHTWPAMFERHPAEWRALLGWCQLHGLDPHRMPADNQIVRDLEHCRVIYDEIVFDDDRPRTDPATLEVVRRRVHTQGETPPAPFPDVILAHLNPTSEDRP